METQRKQFIKHLEKIGRATSTILAYGKDIEQLIEYLKQEGITDLEDVTEKHLKGFKGDLKNQDYTLKSVSRKLNSVKSFFKYLNKEGVVENNPSSDVKHPKYETKPPRVLSPLEYRALRDACKDDTRIYSIVQVLLQTGIRIGELANIQLQDISLEKSTLKIRAYESHDARKVPLNEAAKEAIKSYVKVRPKTKNTTLYITKTGNPFLVRNIRASINRYFDIAGIEDATVNDLRNTFIVEQLKNGVPIVELSEIVGHKRLSTTEKYLQFVEEKPETKKTDLAKL